MKIRYLLIFFLIFSVSCGSDSTGSKPNAPTDEEPKEELQNPQDEFLNHLKGKYKGTYENTTFEVWIETLEQRVNNTGSLAVLMFEQDKSSEIQQFLTKYQDVQVYSKDICEYIKQSSKVSSYYGLMGARGIWNNRGGLGITSFTLANLETTSSFDIETEFFIDLPDDEHGFESLHTDSKGQAIKIQLFETGFFQKLLNYFVDGPNIEIEKISSETTGLLSQYYRNFITVQQKSPQSWRESGCLPVRKF